jgi:energy-converting hydrogenase B subunit Q
MMSKEPLQQSGTLGLVIEATNGPGVLHELSGAVARAKGDITWVLILDSTHPTTSVYFEISGLETLDAVIAELKALPIVTGVAEERPMHRIFGKRVIIMGGGAQVGQVAVGAVSEADRHNLRGERISVDTIPLVGEEALAEAVLAVARLPRARVLVLAGAIMGGKIEGAVRAVREKGLIVISLNMAGSVPEAADLVVSDPIQAGVMAVMAIAETARFSIDRLSKKVY